MRGKPSKLAKEFIDSFMIQNQGTAESYETRIGTFNVFVNEKKKALLDDVVKSLQPPNSQHVYALLSEFVAYMTEKELNARYLNYTLKTVRMFLEYNDVEISPTKFKLKVRVQRPAVDAKTPLSMKDVRDILKACDNIRLKTYVMFLACTGMRAREATQIKVSDLHLDDPKQAYVKVRAGTTKTKKMRDVFLTAEMVDQLRLYLTWKYRERKTQYNYSGDSRKTIYQKFQPEPENTDFLFVPYHHDGKTPTHPRSVYVDLNWHFTRLLKRIGMGKKEEGNARRHEITFHSFRRFVKTEISRLGYEQFSEYFIGHSHSTYWTEPLEKKIETFKKIEPSLTFLDIDSMEAHEQDVTTQLEASQNRIRDLENQLSHINETIYNKMEEYIKEMDIARKIQNDPVFKKRLMEEEEKLKKKGG